MNKSLQRKKSPWKISIFDGSMEYEYEMAISDRESILSVYQRIRELFNVPTSEGRATSRKGGE